MDENINEVDRFRDSKILIYEELSHGRIWDQWEAYLDRQNIAAIDALLGYIATLLNIDNGPKFRTEVFATCNHFILAGSICRAQTEHSYM